MMGEHFDEVDYDEPTVESSGPPDLPAPESNSVDFILGCPTPGCSCHIAHAAGDRLAQAVRFLTRTAELLEARDAEPAVVWTHQ